MSLLEKLDLSDLKVIHIVERKRASFLCALRFFGHPVRSTASGYSSRGVRFLEFCSQNAPFGGSTRAVRPVGLYVWKAADVLMKKCVLLFCFPPLFVKQDPSPPLLHMRPAVFPKLADEVAAGSDWPGRGCGQTFR